MPFLIFEPSADVTDDILRSKTTYAKVRFDPYEAFVDAKLQKTSGQNDCWTAQVDYIPRHHNIPLSEQKAVLCLSRGELGRTLGSIELGPIPTGQ